MRKAGKRHLPSDGFHWEEWRDGVLIRSGHHNGSTLDGKDATYDSAALRVAISAEDFEKVYPK
jgi:hypothetical protein